MHPVVPLDASLSDLGSNAEIKGALFSDRSRDYSDVDITVFEGRLLLTGSMRSEDGRKKLIANAWKADGVNQVIDEIFVGDKTSIGQGFEDAKIDQFLRAKLIADGDVKSGRFKITVSQGVVYLLGQARRKSELDNALRHASSTAGVEKVVSHVTINEPLLGSIDSAEI